jgi:hypothetical protein
MSLIAHLGTLAVLIVDLAVGGPLIDQLAGRWGLIGFEFLLILGYMLLVLELLPWRRPSGRGGGGRPPASP